MPVPFPLRDKVIIYHYEVYNPFLFNNNSFEHNIANQTAGAIYLDYYRFTQQ